MSNQTTKTTPFQLRPLGAADIDATVDLLASAFCDRDPIEAALGITTRDFRSMAHHELPPTLGDGLSIVATTTGTGELVGTMIAADGCTPSPDGPYDSQHKFRPVAALIHSLTSAYLDKQAFNHGESIYLYMLAVVEECEGRGLGKALLAASLERARAQGYHTAFAVVTNLASHRVLARHGFKDLTSTRYADFEYEGKAIFAGIGRHPGITLVEKKLADSA